jgi:hypothetical protein
MEAMILAAKTSFSHDLRCPFTLFRGFKKGVLSACNVQKYCTTRLNTYSVPQLYCRIFSSRRRKIAMDKKPSDKEDIKKNPKTTLEVETDRDNKSATYSSSYGSLPNDKPIKLAHSSSGKLEKPQPIPTSKSMISQDNPLSKNSDEQIKNANKSSRPILSHSNKQPQIHLGSGSSRNVLNPKDAIFVISEEGQYKNDVYVPRDNRNMLGSAFDNIPHCERQNSNPRSPFLKFPNESGEIPLLNLKFPSPIVENNLKVPSNPSSRSCNSLKVQSSYSNQPKAHVAAEVSVQSSSESSSSSDDEEGYVEPVMSVSFSSKKSAQQSIAKKRNSLIPHSHRQVERTAEYSDKGGDIDMQDSYKKDSAGDNSCLEPEIEAKYGDDSQNYQRGSSISPTGILSQRTQSIMEKLKDENPSLEMPKATNIPLNKKISEGSISVMSETRFHSIFGNIYFNFKQIISRVYKRNVSYRNESLLILLLLSPFIVLAAGIYCMDIIVFSVYFEGLIYKVALTFVGIIAVGSADIVNRRHSDIVAIDRILIGRARGSTIAEATKGNFKSNVLSIAGNEKLI